MILIDTSAWVEFLRDTGSNICVRVGIALEGDSATCDAIRMELLAGARSEHHFQMLRRLLAMAVHFPINPVHCEAAAVLFRRCRNEGNTVRKLVDCLIAAVAKKRHGFMYWTGFWQVQVERKQDFRPRDFLQPFSNCLILWKILWKILTENWIKCIGFQQSLFSEFNFQLK